MSILDSVALPHSWPIVRLDSAFSRSHDAAAPHLEPLSVFTDVGVVPRSSRDHSYKALGEDLSKNLRVRPGDLVFNKLRTWQGAIGVSPYEGIVSPAYFVLRPGPSVDSRYFHYLLRSSPWVQELQRVSKFMPPNQNDIGWNDLKRLRVPLPALAVQRAIADHLDSVDADVEALVAGKQAMSALLDERFTSAVFQATTRGLHPDRPSRPSGLKWVASLPQHWGTPPVLVNFELQLGKMVDSSRVDEFDQFPYLRNANVQWDRFQLEDLAVMSFSPEDRLRLALRPGDVLICEGGEVGRAAVWAGEVENCYFQKAVHRARPRHGANSRFLMYALRAAAKMNVFAVEGNLSTIVHLTGEQLAAHRLPWPPEGEQGEIVGYLDGLSVETDALRRRLERQIELLKERRRALITRVVTGEMDVPGAAA